MENQNQNKRHHFNLIKRKKITLHLIAKVVRILHTRLFLLGTLEDRGLFLVDALELLPLRAGSLCHLLSRRASQKCTLQCSREKSGSKELNCSLADQGM